MSSEVLIVAADETLGALLTECLRAHHRCVSASDALEAVRLLGSNRIRLAVIDLDARAGWGMTLCQLIGHAYPRTAVLMIADDDEAIRQWTSAGARPPLDYVIKPVDSSEVLRLAKQALEHKSEDMRSSRFAPPRSGAIALAGTESRFVETGTLAAMSPLPSSRPQPTLGPGVRLKTARAFRDFTTVDRRRAKRTLYQCEVKCERLGEPGFTAEIKDLSVGGAFIDAHTAFDSGSVLKLRFRVGSTEVQIRGEVCYCMPGGGIGVRFLDLDPECRAAIEGVIR